MARKIVTNTKTVMSYSLIMIWLALVSINSQADMIPMRDFNHLKRGMTEAEVLYRVGPYDHESIYTDHYNNIIRKVWYYIPATRGSNSWITEIVINRIGEIQSLERYRARK